VPTVHLSLPEAVYSELKEYANEMGVQITDLIRMMISDGLKKLREERAARMRKQQEETTKVLMEVLQRLEELQNRLEEYQAFVEGELYRLNKNMESLKKRVSKLEDMVDEHLIPVEPELVQP